MLVAAWLRLYHFGQNPPSLYWDEMALAYDSWSITTTGRDYHGQAWPFIAFESYGDYKPSGYFYATALAMKVLGPYDWVVRVPSLLAGLYIVYGCGMLASKIKLTNRKSSQQVFYLAMLIAAVNPALIHLSRVGFETNLATALLLAGVLCLWPSEINDKTLKKTIDWQLLAGELLLIASFYTYHATRVVAPLLGVYLVLWRGLKILLLAKYEWEGGCSRQNKGLVDCQKEYVFSQKTAGKYLVVNSVMAGALAVFLTLPFWLSMGKQEVTSRWQTTSLLSDLSLIEESNQCLALAGGTWLARLWCHRWWFFAREIEQNWWSHFDVDYLFITGDANRRHSVGLFGIFYPFEIVFLAVGMMYGWLHKKQWSTILFVIYWLVVGVFPSSLTVGTPHLLRTENILPLLIVGCSLGVWQIAQWINQRWQKLYYCLMTGMYMASVVVYQYYYHNYYQKEYAGVWQDGYRQAVEQLAAWQEKYPDMPVYFTRELGRPALYYLWYNQIHPSQVQTVVDDEKKDQGELMTFTPDQVAFGTGLLSREQLLVLTAREAEVVSWEASGEVVNQRGEVVLIVGKEQRQEIGDDKAEKTQDTSE